MNRQIWMNETGTTVIVDHYQENDDAPIRWTRTMVPTNPEAEPITQRATEKYLANLIRNNFRCVYHYNSEKPL